MSEGTVELVRAAYEVRDRAITAIRVFLDERRAAEAARSQS